MKLKYNELSFVFNSVHAFASGDAGIMVQV